MDDFDVRGRELSGYRDALRKADIVVTVSGGVVTSVRTRGGKESHVVIDYDNIRTCIDGAVEELVDNAFVGTRSTM